MEENNRRAIIEEIIEIVEAKKEKAEKSHNRFHLLGPNSYGTGMCYGEMEGIRELIEELKEII